MIGEVIAGRYRLIGLIGEGATGTVYQAVVLPDGEKVAIKVLRQGGPRAAGLKAGLKAGRLPGTEAAAVGKLEHPNLVAMRDFGALDDGRPYLVMDLVDGRNLAQLLAEERRLPDGRALAILAHLLRALGHAHARGVVHRRLEPADIVLVERDGDPDFAILVDVGTAAILGGADPSVDERTRAGTEVGAPAAYQAPERLDPALGPVDGRADLYAATCILFEMMTGQAPYGAGGTAESQGTLQRHASRSLPALSADLKPTPALEAIVARGLATKPADRFASADEYLAAVEACLVERRDPRTMATPRSAPAGETMVEPDPSRATTVLHGAPAAAPAAPTMSALGSSAAAVEPPAIESPPAGGAAPDAGGPSGRKWRLPAVGAGVLAALVLVLALVFRGGGEPGGRSAEANLDPVAGLVDAWRAAGLQPGDFVPVPGENFGGGDCRSGKVSAIDVTVCLYPTAEQARKGRRAGLRALKGVTRTAIPSGKRLLLAARGPGSDEVKTMERVTEVFRKAPPPPGESRAGRR